MEYKLTFTQEDLNILSAGLIELPYKMSAPLISKINKQLVEQSSDSKQEDKPCTE